MIVVGVVTGVLWLSRKLVPNLMYLSGLTLFGAEHGGSEVCDGSALGFCCRNSDSCRCSYWCIVVVQEIGA